MADRFMIINSTGKIIDNLYMVGHPAMPVYLLDGEKPVIFDAGPTFLGNMYTDGIREIIGNRELHYCFLTHSHFDQFEPFEVDVTLKDGEIFE